jgi:nitrate/nitrite transporter NarK
MFTAWGVGGLILPRIAGMVKDITGKEDMAFYIASALMVCGAVLALVNQAMSKGKRNRKDKTHLPPSHPVAGI